MRIFFFIFLFFAFCCDAVYGFERIVSLSPALTEMVVYAGGKGKLVGVTDFCSLDLKAERVGGIVNPNIEKIVSLRPDLILVTNMTPVRIRKLLSKMAEVRVFHLVSLEDVERAVKSVGNLVGANGEELEQRFERSLHRSIEGIRCLNGKRTFILISCKPIYVAGGRSYLGEAFSLAGVRIFPPDVTFGAVSSEYVVNNGKVVVLACQSGGEELENLFKAFGMRIYRVSPKLLLHPSPWFLKGIRFLGEKVCASK